MQADRIRCKPSPWIPAVTPLQKAREEWQESRSPVIYLIFRRGKTWKRTLLHSRLLVVLLPGHITPVMYVTLPLVSMLVDGLWYAFVAYALSLSRPRNSCLRFKTTFDRIGGSVMAMLGIKLIVK